MKPPTTEALQKALAILLESVDEQNATHCAREIMETNQDPHNTDSLSVIDDRLDMLHLACAGLGSFARPMEDAYRRRRNVLAPINTLPLELVTQILQLSLDRTSSRMIHRVREVAGVCSQWWTVIHSIPMFWDVVELGDNVPLALKMSRGIPMTGRIADHRAGELAPPTWKQMEMFMAIINKNVERWKELSFASHHFWYIDKHLPPPSDRLEKLSFHSIEGLHPAGPKMIELASCSPNLRRLAVRNTSLPWNTGIFVNLITLHISSIVGGSTPVLRDLYNILHDCPELEELVIKTLYPPIGAPGAPLPPNSVVPMVPIHLPRLHKLVLQDCGELTCIVDSIRAPSLSTLLLSFPSEYNYAYAPACVMNFLSAVDADALLPSVLSNFVFKELTLKFHGTSFELFEPCKGAQWDRRRFELNFQWNSALTSAFHVLMDILSDTKTPIQLHFRNSTGLSTVPSCKAMKYMTALYLKDDGSVSHHLLTIFAKPDGSSGWACPNLGVFQVVSDYLEEERTRLMADLVSLFQSRGNDGPLGEPRPKPLEVLDHSGAVYDRISQSFEPAGSVTRIP